MWKTRNDAIAAAIACLTLFSAAPAASAAALTSLCVCQTGSGNCTEETIEWAQTPAYEQVEDGCNAKCPGGSGDFRFSVSDKNAGTVAAARAGCPNLPSAAPLDPTKQEIGGRTIQFTKPELSFDIPNLSFTEPLVRDNKLEVAYLAEYITAAYRMLLGISITIAIVMVMLGGIQYVLGAGSGEVKKAKERITNAVTGLVLMLGVYVILFTINPQLTLLPALQVDLVSEISIEREDDEVAGALAIDFKAPSGSNLQGPGLAQIPAELTGDIEAVAKEMGEGYGIRVASSFRSEEKQKELIKENCQNPPGSATCNPKPGKPQTCILKNGPASCPHTTGRALDLWATKKNSEGVMVQCVSQKPTCMNNMNTCFNDPCQKKLIDLMKQHGFCVLGSEAWHFEKPKMSSNCR